MERKASKTEKGRERARKRSIDYKKSRPVFNIGMAVAGGIAAVLSGSSTRAETLEERLGNIENYRPVEFVGDPETTGIAWCRVQGNTMRWLPFNRANLDEPTPVLEQDFSPMFPHDLIAEGAQRVVHPVDSEQGYWTSFNTPSGYRFEHIGSASERRFILYRERERIIESPSSGPGAFDWGPVAPLWNGKIGIIASGFDRGGTFDSSDIFELDENETSIPITTREQFLERTVRRTDLNPDPPESDRANLAGNFACTENYCFVPQVVIQGLRAITPALIHVCDRSPDDQCINQRLLSNDPNLIGVQCAFENPDSIVLFVKRNVYELWAATYLKDADSDEVPNLVDNCRDIPNPADEFGRQPNSDEDSLGDICDQCPQDSLAGETDDPDNDNVCNRVGNESLGTTGDDNCSEVANPDQLDTDSDRRGNVCDSCPGDRENDRDRDDVCAGNPVGDELANDNCPINRNPDQLDTDMDGAGDACDNCSLDPLNDEDMDFFCADEDPCPRDFENRDPDNDGLCADEDPCPTDPTNPDIDLDGKCDNEDPCPTDPHDRDRDEDGICDVTDPCVEGFEQCQIEQPDAGMTDGGNKDASISDAAIPPTPDAHTTTQDASNDQRRDADAGRSDVETTVSEPPKDGCVDCNQSVKTPEGLIALFGLALSRVLRRKERLKYTLN